MARPYALLRSGFPYHMTLGMRRVTSNAVDVALGAGGVVYVLCRGGLGTEIRVVNFDDENLGTIGGAGAGEGQFTWPTCLIRDAEENLYVSDEALHRISVFSKESEFLGSWGEHGSAEGQLDRPSGIGFDADENMYVSDTLNHRVQKFTKDGEYLGGWGSHGASEGEFDLPWGIAVDELGDVYVADWRNDRVQKFTADGEFLSAIGESGSGDGQFSRPSGVCVDADGDVYVADWGNDRVQLFNQHGQYVEKFIGDANLSKSGLQYVLSNQITLRLRDMSRLEAGRRLRGPISVRVDDEGRLYIPDYGSHRVQIYKKEAYALTESQIAPLPRNPMLLTT